MTEKMHVHAGTGVCANTASEMLHMSDMTEKNTDTLMLIADSSNAGS